MSQGGVAAHFRKHPGPALVAVIRDSGRPVVKKDVVDAVVAAGLDEKTVEAAWKRLLPFIKDHPQVKIVKTRSYEWAVDPIAPSEALTRMRREHTTRTPAWLLEALALVVESGLRESEAAPQPSPAREERDRSAWAAQERQWKIDIVRAVAEIAIVVEEITYKGAEPNGILERVRNRALAHSLAPIGRSGEEMKFDPAKHAALVGSPDTGSSVVVIRPGYTWHGDGADVLIERAVVRTV